MMRISSSVSVWATETGNTRQQPQSDEALLSVDKAIILIGEGQAFEDARGINEVKAMIFEADDALALGPGETHVQM